MSISRRTTRILAATLALGNVACALSPVEGEVADPSTPARIERRETVAFVGYAWWIEIDSATATLRVRCEQATGTRVGTPCNNIPTSIVRALPRGTVDQLFRDANSSAFRSLNAEYDMSGTFVDGPAYSVSVTANGRARKIQWSDAANPTLPVALQRVAQSIVTLAALPPAQ